MGRVLADDLVRRVDSSSVVDADARLVSDAATSTHRRRSGGCLLRGARHVRPDVVLPIADRRLACALRLRGPAGSHRRPRVGRAARPDGGAVGRCPGYRFEALLQPVPDAGTCSRRRAGYWPCLRWIAQSALSAITCWRRSLCSSRSVRQTSAPIMAGMIACGPASTRSTCGLDRGLALAAYGMSYLGWQAHLSRDSSSGGDLPNVRSASCTGRRRGIGRDSLAAVRFAWLGLAVEVALVAGGFSGVA